MSFEEIRANVQTLHPEEGLKWLNKYYGATVKLSTALGPEAQLLTYWISRNHLHTEVFTIDTGRLFQETYDLLELTNTLLKNNIKVYYPDTGTIEKMVSRKGPNSFYHSIENRIECCDARKVMPLKRALTGATVWVTGVRADQSHSRTHMKKLEWNETYNVIKYNPLLDWSAEQVLDLIDEFNIPTNTLHRQGYASIGCQPCTRAIRPGEDERSGRWWWENSHKECGLHVNHATADVQ